MIFSSILSRVWGYILAAGAALAVIGLAWRRGAKSTSARVNAEASKSNERMLEAAVSAPQEKDRVVKDLRSGRF